MDWETKEMYCDRSMERAEAGSRTVWRYSRKRQSNRIPSCRLPDTRNTQWTWTLCVSKPYVRFRPRKSKGAVCSNDGWRYQKLCRRSVVRRNSSLAAGKGGLSDNDARGDGGKRRNGGLKLNRNRKHFWWIYRWSRRQKWTIINRSCDKDRASNGPIWT